MAGMTTRFSVSIGVVRWEVTKWLNGIVYAVEKII